MLRKIEFESIPMHKFGLSYKDLQDASIILDCSLCVFHIDDEQQTMEFRDECNSCKLKYEKMTRRDHYTTVVYTDSKDNNTKILIFKSYMRVTEL